MLKDLKAIGIFGLISIGITLMSDLIKNQFNVSNYFGWDYLIYNVAIEFGFVIVTAFFANLIIRKISKDSLGMALTKALIFGVVYANVSFVSLTLYASTLGLENFTFDFFRSFLFYIPFGFTQGILFLFVWHYLGKK